MNYELCEFVNHTFVTLEITKEILSIEGRNTITGQMGRCVDRMLCSPDKRKCKIIGESSSAYADLFFMRKTCSLKMLRNHQEV